MIKLIFFLYFICICSFEVYSQTQNQLHLLYIGKKNDIKQFKIEGCVLGSSNITPNGSLASNNFYFSYPIYNGYELELKSLHCDSIRTIPLSDLKQYQVMTIQQLKQKVDYLDKQPKMFVDTVPSNAAQFRHSNGSWYLSRIKHFYVVERDEATQTARITKVKISIAME